MQRAGFSTVLVLIATPVWGDIIFSNLGPGGTFDSSAGVSVNRTYEEAVDFVAGSTGALGQIRLPLAQSEGLQGAAALTITLRAGVDPTMGPYGTVLDSWTLAPADVPDITGALVTLPSSLGPTLNAGDRYWLRLESTETSDSYIWFLNITGDVARAESTDGGPTWTYFWSATAPALEVDSQVVPEPAAVLLLGSVVAVFGFYRSRRNV